MKKIALYLTALLILLSSFFMVGCSTTRFRFDGSITNVSTSNESYNYDYLLTITTGYDKNAKSVEFVVEILDDNNKVIDTDKKQIFFKDEKDRELYKKDDNFNFEIGFTYKTISMDKGKPSSINVTDFKIIYDDLKLIAIIGGVVGGAVVGGLIATFIAIKCLEKKKSKTKTSAN